MTESVEKDKLASIGDAPKTGEESAPKGELQKNSHEASPKPSVAAENEQYPKSLDVVTESDISLISLLP